MMKLIQRAHVLVVATGYRRMMLAAHLCRMQIARASFVDALDEAREVCLAGGPDLCLVAFDDRAVDAAPAGDIDAPGQDRGFPALMLVGTVTPYMRRLARECGYSAAVPAAITPRMLYRRMSAALQQRQAQQTWPRLPSAVSAGTRRIAIEMAELRKSTRH
jgi:AmiR/NasT family two-component response regulator